MDALAPLETFARFNPDYNQSDHRQETALLLQRQDLAERVLRGDSSVDELLDCLKLQGIDPDAYSNAVVDNIDWVLSREIPIDVDSIGFFLSDNGLWVPGTH